MHSNWRTTTLGETLPFSYGKNLPAKTRSHTGEFDVVTSAGVVDSHNEAYVHVPSIVIGRKGTIGSLTYCPNPVWPTDTTFFATETDACDLRFGYYLLHTLHLRELNNDSAVPGLNRSDAHALEIHLPPLSEQVGIAKVLGALDDKITANVRVLEAANELVKNLYTAIPKSSNHAIESIGELVKKNVKPEEMDDSKALINLEHFDSKQIWISRHAQVPEATSAKSSFLVGDVLFGKLRPYFHKVGVAPIGGYCSTDVLVVRPREDSYRGLLLAAMSAEETVAIATQNSNGTRMPRAKWTDIASCAIPDPDDPKSTELGKLMDVLIPKCNALIHENHVLARTRDELLPLLMSGRITVGEAEDVAGTAASES
ncbi:restriction endonuclease subunit S [Corynebacterium striatum]|nr:hypothetical protein [Corynebacterium striatum]HAT6549913.1 hypothetical protein [Corynebacterium striatum]HAT6629238.1 hypothetical protein [Corynebacterium striatum]HAT6634197.1 hypothetical protein [Corynebacterium striatum]